VIENSKQRENEQSHSFSKSSESIHSSDSAYNPEIHGKNKKIALKAKPASAVAEVQNEIATLSKKSKRQADMFANTP